MILGKALLHIMGGCQILYVEDDESDVTVLRHAFRLAEVDISFCHVPDGQAAVEYLTGQGVYRDRARFPLPSLLLVDVKMPRLGGLELLQWIRSQPELAGLVVVMFSSSNQDQDIRRAWDLGANSYVVKPHGLQAAIKLVRALDSWWFNQNEFARLNRRISDHAIAA
jgi:CheY-like chemotaxis protein